MIPRLGHGTGELELSDGFSRRLRGAFGNALVWGAGWATLWLVAVTIFTVLGMTGVLPGFSWGAALGLAVRFGVMFGLIGFLTGGVFSSLVGLLYRGRRLAEIGWVKFGLGGGIVAAVFVPLFLQAMNLLSGDGLVAWALVLDDAFLTGVFGAVAAGGSLKLAQVADRMLPDGGREELEGPGGSLETEGL